MNLDYEVVIIGGGPAGATMGLLLARAGWSVAIIEKKMFPRRKVCGEFISATSLPLLQQLAIAEEYFKNGGPPVQNIGLITGNTILTAKMPTLKHQPEQWGRAIGREQLDTILLNQAAQAGAQIWQPWSAQALQKSENGFICTINNKEQTQEISTRMVIIAQGSWERSVLPGKIKSHQSTDLLAFKAHFKNGDLTRHFMPLLAFPGGYGGLVHSSSELVTLSCCIRRDTLQNIRKRYSGLAAGEAVLQHIRSSCSPADNIFRHAQRQNNWLSAGPLQPGIRHCYQDGIFFIGNAAGEAHPVIAEGISMAMQSAWILSRILSKQPHNSIDQIHLDQVGKQYTQLWLRQFKKRIIAAAVFAQLAMRPQIHRYLLPIFNQFPQLLSYGAHLSGKDNAIMLAQPFS